MEREPSFRSRSAKPVPPSSERDAKERVTTPLRPLAPQRPPGPTQRPPKPSATTPRPPAPQRPPIPTQRPSAPSQKPPGPTQKPLKVSGQGTSVAGLEEQDDLIEFEDTSNIPTRPGLPTSQGKQEVRRTPGEMAGRRKEMAAEWKKIQAEGWKGKLRSFLWLLLRLTRKVMQWAWEWWGRAWFSSGWVIRSIMVFSLVAVGLIVLGFGLEGSRQVVTGSSGPPIVSEDEWDAPESLQTTLSEAVSWTSGAEIWEVRNERLDLNALWYPDGSIMVVQAGDKTQLTDSSGQVWLKAGQCWKPGEQKEPPKMEDVLLPLNPKLTRWRVEGDRNLFKASQLGSWEAGSGEATFANNRLEGFSYQPDGEEEYTFKVTFQEAQPAPEIQACQRPKE